MEQYIALIWNTSDVYNRHWIKQNSDETPEKFIQRVKNCYGNNQWVIYFYKATPIDA